MYRDDEGIHVLHVDDDPSIAELTAEMLEVQNEGIAVETATNADDGLSRLTDGDIDCVVSDYQMPGMDGIEFLETLRERGIEIPFILFTGKGSETVASKAISAGATDYLQKGSGTERYELLAHRIENAVTHARANHRQERRLDAIETAQEGISVLDSRGQYIYVNERYADIFGYEPDDLLGESKDITYSDGTTVREDVLPTVRRQGRIQRETTAQNIDGEGVPIRYSLATTGNDEFVCTVRDLSEPRMYQREWDATTTVLGTVVENLPIGVLVEDADRTIKMANDRLCEMLGLTASGDELVGYDCTVAAEEAAKQFADPETFRDSVEERIAHREPVRREKLELADGRTLERDYLPYELPAGPANLWFYRDVTDRRTRKQRYQQSHRRFEAVFESTESFFAVLAPDGTVETINERALEFVDADISDVRGEQFWTTPWWTHSESLQEDLRSWIDQAADGDHVQYEAVHYAPDGEKVTADGVLRPVVDDGEVVLLVAEAWDITEHKRRKQALEQQNERLEEFASVVSHDLRNPLNVASSRLELARDDHESEHLEHVADALERMETIIDDVLAVARDGKDIREPEVVSLVETVGDCWGTVGTESGDLIVETDVTIRADPGRLRQLFENLFRNATDHGGPDVTVTVGDCDGGFYVSDDGPGIPEAERERVFQSGYSTADSGTGFGLNIVEEVATAHGWTSRITESADGGTRFEFTGVESGN